MRLFTVQMVHPYSSTNIATALKKYHFISSEIKVLYDRQPGNNGVTLFYAHVNVIFCR